METYKKTIRIILFILLMGVVNGSYAQYDDVKEMTYLAYLTKNMEMWQKGLEMHRKAYKADQNNASLLGLTLTQYGVLNATVIEKDEDIFDKYEEETIENLEELIDDNKKEGEPKAILSAIYGLKMAYSPWKGIFLGSKSSNLMESATRVSKDSPLVWKLYANSKLYTPENFGGDKVEAAKGFEKAISLYEQAPENLENNWLYLDALAHLGITYMKLDKPRKAREVFEKALKFEPEFNWVKYVLLPKVAKS